MAMESGIGWKFTRKLEDLDFADDITLLSSTKKQIQEKKQQDYRRRQEEWDFNGRKTKVMRINVKSHDKIKVEGQDIEDVDEFTYLGATVCQK